MLYVILGHETTTYTLCFLFLDLAKHPECAKRVQEGLDDYMPSELPGQGHSKTQAEISEMCSALYKHEYFNNCIKEVITLYDSILYVNIYYLMLFYL